MAFYITFTPLKGCTYKTQKAPKIPQGGKPSIQNRLTSVRASTYEALSYLRLSKVVAFIFLAMSFFS